MKTLKTGLVGIIHYSVTNSKGDVLMSTFDKEPMPYLHGAGNVLSGLENGLCGLKVGDTKNITVEPESGYGVRDEQLSELTIKRDSDAFRMNSGWDLKVGDCGLAETADINGKVTLNQSFWIIDLDDESVTIDLNHPLAGEQLNFDVEIVAIREPTLKEYAYGHPHSIHGEEPF